MKRPETVTSESLIEFPCHLPVKVMGHHAPDFREQMIAAIANEHGPVEDHHINVKLSRDERFISLTITVYVTDHDQLRRIYGAMHATGLVLYAL
jgi:putative lipoic acid-binding regulatory protein